MEFLGEVTGKENFRHPTIRGRGSSWEFPIGFSFSLSYYYDLSFSCFSYIYFIEAGRENMVSIIL